MNRSFSWPTLTYLSVAILSGVGLLGKADLVHSVSHLPMFAIYPLVGLAILLPFLWPLALRHRFVIAPIALAGLALALLVVLPRTQALHRQGRGSDQPDCVIVAAKAMVHGQWPYDREQIWSHNPMSCGPGWVAINAPLVTTLGYALTLVVVWGASLFFLTKTLGWEPVAGIVSLLAFSPGLWLAAANGTDFLTFGIVLVALSVAAITSPNAPALAVLGAFVGQFRIMTILLPILWGRSDQRPLNTYLPSAVGLATQVGFLLWDAPRFVMDGPLFIVGKIAQSLSFSTVTAVAIIQIVVSVVVGAVAVGWLRNHVSSRVAILGYMACICLAPAILNFGLMMRLNGGVIYALSRWEGGMWIAGILPFAAFALLDPMSAKVEPIG